MWAMNWRGMVAVLVTVIVAVAITVILAVVMIATATMADEVARRGTPPQPVPTSTFIPAPKVGIYQCIWDADGFDCVEVTEGCR